MSPTTGPYSNPGVTGATTGPYAGTPAVPETSDRRALDDIAEACGARRGDHRANVVMVVRSMLQDPAVHNAGRARALAVVERLVDALQNLIEDSPDPGTEALGAVWEGRQFVVNGGGALAAAATPAPPAVLVERDGRRWLCPVGAPQEHPWLVPVDWDELICSLCVEDEKCCECDSPDLITLIEHKTRVWAGQSTPAPPVDGECSGCGEVHGDEPCGWYERPPEPTLADYEQYIRKQVAEEPYSTYARGVVRDLLVELDRLRAIKERARAVVEDTGKSEPVHRNASYILGEVES